MYADQRIPPGPLPVERAAVRNPRNTPRFGLAAGSARVLMTGERGSFEGFYETSTVVLLV